jgi:uracil-DNA glycosylase family 4
VRNVTDRTSDPFDLNPPCDRSVPGYGDANAHFHVVGDHPGRHGGVETGIPFTGSPATERLQRALRDGGLLEETGTPPIVDRTYLSYLHMCVVDGDRDPTPAEYDDMERFFDAELRAIAAHVLLPVGRRAVWHVLREYTARDPSVADDLKPLHATEIRGGGWLVLPILDPVDWAEGDDRRLVDALIDLRRTDYRRESDLGRFLAGDEPYFVR